MKIGIFADKEDIEINLTNDNIINITGMMGSGKTTLAREIKDKQNIDLLSLDWMFGYSLGNRPEKINNMMKEFEKIYTETKNQQIFKNYHKRKKDKKVELKYYEYTDIIYTYLIENIKEPQIIEGRHIYKYMNLNLLRGKIIIKRTSLIHAYKRAFKRDVGRQIELYKKGEISLTEVLDKIRERIKFPIQDYIEINKFISKLLEQNLLNKK